MKWLKNSIALTLVGLFFLASSGVIMHHHYCKKDGHSVSFYLPVKHTCEPIAQTESCTVDSCCKAIGMDESNKDFPFVDKEPCCIDAFQYLQFDQDYVSQQVEKITFTFLFDFPFTFSTNMNTVELVNKEKGRAPPLPQPLSIQLAILQQYLI